MHSPCGYGSVQISMCELRIQGRLVGFRTPQLLNDRRSVAILVACHRYFLSGVFSQAGH